MVTDIVSKKAIQLHHKYNGKIKISSKIPSIHQKDIKLIYTPGVAAVSKEIVKRPNQKYLLTSKSNNVAIVTDGTRLLGLGNVGPDAALPVMEGKSLLYKKYGSVDAYPICLNTTKKDEIITVVKAIEPVFGAINLEDIESPKVIEISEILEKQLTIPVFHDDRHGTSVVVLAALLNSLKIVRKQLDSVKIVIAGAGSAGYGICKLLKFAGSSNMIVVDSIGAIYAGRKNDMTKYKKEIAKITNQKKEKGPLEQILRGSDVFIGVSGVKNLLNSKMIKNMNENAIVFALTNPEPEVSPSEAVKAGAKIVATGSYQFQNRVNNALVFPYLMRAILDYRIKRISPKLLLAVSEAIAKSISVSKRNHNHIIPEIGEKSLQKNINLAIRSLKK